MASNKRIYFANQMVAFAADGTTGGDRWYAAHGVQTVAVTTTFNLEQAFELGQLSIYENIEGVPDVEVTATKVLDGYPLLYHFATNKTTYSAAVDEPTLAGRSATNCLMALGIWDDTDDSAEGTLSSQMECSGLFCSSVAYNFPTEDNFTEDVTLVGNNKAWISGNKTNFYKCLSDPWALATLTGTFDGSDVPTGTGGVNRRENLAFATGSNVLTGGFQANKGWDYCRLPTEIPGVNSTGWINPKAATDDGSLGPDKLENLVHITNISVSTDLGREDLFELGTRQPYTRPVTFPVEVTCDIEVISVSGDLINAFADGCTSSAAGCEGVADNLSNQVIRLATCEGTRIYLGQKNKLASVNYGGGDAGGGNVSVTYSYTTFNDFTVIHPEDPNAGGDTWWNTRSGFLGFGSDGAPVTP